MPDFVVDVRETGTGDFLPSSGTRSGLPGGGVRWVTTAQTPLGALRQAYNQARADSISVPLATLPDLTAEEMQVVYDLLDAEIKRMSTEVSQANVAEHEGRRTNIAELGMKLAMVNSIRTAFGETIAVVTRRNRAIQH